MCVCVCVCIFPKGVALPLLDDYANPSIPLPPSPPLFNSILESKGGPLYLFLLIPLLLSSLLFPFPFFPSLAAFDYCSVVKISRGTHENGRSGKGGSREPNPPPPPSPKVTFAGGTQYYCRGERKKKNSLELRLEFKIGPGLRRM